MDANYVLRCSPATAGSPLQHKIFGECRTSQTGSGERADVFGPDRGRVPPVWQ